MTRRRDGLLWLGMVGMSVSMIAGGCDGAAAPGATPSVSPTVSDAGAGDAALVAYCDSPAPGTLDLIDDMEDGDDAIANRSGRGAWWYTYHDETSGVMNPDQGTSVTMETIRGGRCGSSQKAMRVTGSGFMNWGAGFGIDLKFPPASTVHTTYDASATHGVSFWARIGETSVKMFRIDMLDAWSDPIGEHCDKTVVSGPTACYDGYGHEFSLSAVWQRVSYTWGELGQRSFGLPRPDLDVAEMTQIHFGIPPSSPVFDIWIDDISFF